MRKTLPVLLLAALFLQALTQVRAASLTFDEGPHLAVGYTTLRTGDLRLQPVHIHPPLANVVAALPLLGLRDLPDPRTIDGWEIASLSAVTDAVVWQYPQPRRLALAGRLPIVWMTVLLAALVYRWAADLGGRRAGLLALALCAFDPNIIAHGSLVTTDMAVTLWGTAALFFSARLLRRARWGYWLGAGLALGLALASKVSAISLIPVLLLLWLLTPGLRWRSRLLAAAGALALAGLVLWAAYGFELRSLPGWPIPIPAATHLEIYFSLQEHYALGHPAFLWGQNTSLGWWYYFPIAFFLKTPLPTLLLGGAALGYGVYRIANYPFEIRDSNCEFRIRNRQSATRNLQLFPLLLFPLLYAASTPLSSVNIGYRHLLPLLPFLYILTAHLIPSTVYRLPSTIHRLPLYALLLWLLLGTARVLPYPLAFFNELAGGPDGGYRYLVDSNLDWGQNLWQLRDWLAARGVERVYYAHYSPADPQVYGLAADWLPPDPRAVPFTPLDPAPGVYAIGATVLQGVYTPDVNTYAWFRSHEPLARLGHALFVYQVPARTAPAWAAVCAGSLPTLDPQIVRGRLGRPDLRVVTPDCQQGWFLPTGERDGVYVLPPGADPPPGALLDLQARNVDGSPRYTVYRLPGGTALPQTATAVALQGPLAFSGCRVVSDTVRPGETVELWTFWQVEQPPARPLSLMGHLLGADGVPLAVSDGLGLPVEQWQAGDQFIQRHRLTVPQDTPPGDYRLQTGAYWLDTLERWPVQVDGQSAGDVIPLPTISVGD